MDFKDKLLEKYQEDKKWCIDYHNKGEVEIYNMIFGRLQGYAIVDTLGDLGLDLANDMVKNIPWNKKMLAGNRTTIVEYTKEDIENFNKEI
jgi:hypothetical protein